MDHFQDQFKEFKEFKQWDREETNLRDWGKHAEEHTSENIDLEQEHKKETQTNSRNYSGSKSSVVEQLLGSKVMHSSCSSSSSSGREDKLKTFEVGNWKNMQREDKWNLYNRDKSKWKL